VKRIPLGTNPNAKQEAIFLVIWCANAKPWLFYDEASDATRHQSMPAFIMLDRYDGNVGFIGGGRKPQSSLIESLQAELEEETGLGIEDIDLSKVELFASHELSIVTHIAHYQVEFQEFLTLQACIASKQSQTLHQLSSNLNQYQQNTKRLKSLEIEKCHFMAEVTGVKSVLVLDFSRYHPNGELDKSKGIINTLQSSFSSSVIEEMVVFLIEIIGIPQEDVERWLTLAKHDTKAILNQAF